MRMSAFQNVHQYFLRLVDESEASKTRPDQCAVDNLHCVFVFSCLAKSWHKGPIHTLKTHFDKLAKLFYCKFDTLKNT